MKKKYVYILDYLMSNKNKIIAIIFFLFFTTPILSPSFFGMTLYIHWFIPLFDLDFIKYVFSIKLNKQQKISAIISIFVIIILLKYKFAIEMIFLVETLLYIVYAYKNSFLKYFFIGINFNILIASIQFISYYFDPNLAIFLGPTNIANLIWGNHATATFTNMFTQFGLVKVAGWSREHGFFNALMIMSFLLYHYVDLGDKKKYQYILIILGFIMSISKNSILIIFVLLLIPLRKYFNKIPFALMLMIIILVGFSTSFIMIKYDMYNPATTTNYESYTHRFSGYTVMYELTPTDLITGIDSINNLPENIWEESPYLQYISRFGEFCGLPALIIHNGIIVSTIYFLFLYYYLNFKSFGLACLTLITLTTTYITLTSFVVIGYFVVMYLENNNKCPFYLIE